MDIASVKVPKKIDSCPIAEAIVELRFDTSIPAEVFIGLAINKLTERYPNLVKLPILQIPEVIRNKETSLVFNPHYRLSNNDYIFQIGPKCISINCPKEYKGWKRYYEEIEWVIKEINEMKFIQKPLRVGVRYINFFADVNIFEKIKINLSLSDIPLINHRNFLRSEFNYNEFRCIMQISNEALLENTIKGSGIDIDVISENITKIENSFNKIVFAAHEVVVKLFFNILKNEFIGQFNPEYD